MNLTFLDSLADVRAFGEEFHMTFPVLLDSTGEVAEIQYRLISLPMSVFVNRQGVIQRIHIGAMGADQIRDFVGEILQ